MYFALVKNSIFFLEPKTPSRLPNFLTKISSISLPRWTWPSVSLSLSLSLFLFSSLFPSSSHNIDVALESWRDLTRVPDPANGKQQLHGLSSQTRRIGLNRLDQRSTTILKKILHGGRNYDNGNRRKTTTIFAITGNHVRGRDNEEFGERWNRPKTRDAEFCENEKYIKNNVKRTRQDLVADWSWVRIRSLSTIDPCQRPIVSNSTVNRRYIRQVQSRSTIMSQKKTCNGRERC